MFIQSGWGLDCRRSCAGSVRTPAASSLPSLRTVRRELRGIQANEAASAGTQALSSRSAGPFPALVPLDAEYEARHTFSSFANWLVPGRIMLGRYPYVEPSRCTSREQGEEQLQQILEAGITTFVCLQDEVPAQEHMRLAGVDGFMPYKATAELILASMAGPPPAEIVDGLRNPTLDKFLPARRRPNTSSYTSHAQKEAVKFVYSPIVDLGIPDEDRLRTLIANLELRVAAGESLYIHCWGGRGRAGTVGCCLLASMYGIPSTEALTRVQRAFDTRCDNQRRSPETDQQHAFVRAFIDSAHN